VLARLGSLRVFLVLALILGVFLHFSVYGRYLYAIGSNEQAARYSGIATDRYKIVASMLTSAGYTCKQASSGMEALAVLNSGEAFELLLSDLMMQDLNGIGLLWSVGLAGGLLGWGVGGPLILVGAVAGAGDLVSVLAKLRGQRVFHDVGDGLAGDDIRGLRPVHVALVADALRLRALVGEGADVDATRRRARERPPRGHGVRVADVQRGLREGAAAEQDQD